MARALECPACGHRHRLDTIPAAATFRCEQCGQVLKAPTAVSSQPGAPAPPARGSAPPARTSTPAGAPEAAATTAAAPPRRTTAAPNGDNGTRAAPVRTAAAVSATVSATADDSRSPDDGARGRRRAPAAAAPASTAAAPGTKVHWYWRLVAWIVAVPLGFLLTAWPAYQFGFIKKDELLDIFVGTGIGRYVRLAIVTLVWGLVTALLVQLFVEGGRARANRRRRARSAAA